MFAQSRAVSVHVKWVESVVFDHSQSWPPYFTCEDQTVVVISLVGEIHHSCSSQEGAADLAISSQLCQCVQVIQDTNQYDANDTRVPEISIRVPWRRPHAGEAGAGPK